MNLRLSRWMAGAMLMFSAIAMFAVTSDAEARRMGAGRSIGKQSTNVTQQRQAVTPPAATTTQRASSASAGAASAGTAAAGTAARSGMSRWLGPIAGIAAGLGIAALLSSLGLSGAFLELLSSMILIGLLAFAVLWLVRRLRGAQQPMATAGQSYRRGPSAEASWPRQPSGGSAGPAAAGVAGTVSSSVSAAPSDTGVPSPAADPSWFIPADFDVSTFLAQAKQQFVHIQALWDAGNQDGLREYLTDDLMAEAAAQLPQPNEGNRTNVVLLNAELLGIETIDGGHLASVRYSGMLREAAESEAFRFEEVWNLFKGEGQGWLLAGIQRVAAPH